MRKDEGPTEGKGRRIKIFEADEGVGMTEAEAKRFLTESRSVVKLGTLDASGDPNVHPVWYCFEPKELALYAFVGKNTKKARNIEERHRVYFDVDDDRWPYKGVRGKGAARELVGGDEKIAIVERIVARYVKKGHPMFLHFVESARKGAYTIYKITPRYLSTWDYSRMPADALSAGLDVGIKKVRVASSFPPDFFDGLTKPPLVMEPGERFMIEDADSEEWPAFSLVTNSKGGRGWVPTRYLRRRGKVAVALRRYDTTTLSPGRGETLDVIEEDPESGWLWCRDVKGNLGWFAIDHVEPVGK